MPEDKKEEKKTVEITGDAVEKLIDQVIPKTHEEKLRKLLDNMQPQHRLHPDKVAVYEVSMATMAGVDGTPGWYDIMTGSEESRELGLSTTQERTKEGLVIYDRFQVVHRVVPMQVWMHKYTIVDKEEYLKQEESAARGMLTNAQQMAALMQRAGE